LFNCIRRIVGTPDFIYIITFLMNSDEVDGEGTAFYFSTTYVPQT